MAVARSARQAAAAASTGAGPVTVMVAQLRRHGAVIVERHGRLVAANFGSAASEAAVCRSSVGLAERSDRVTLDVRGDGASVDAALAALGPIAHSAWSTRLSPGRAIVRCEGELQDECRSAMLAAVEEASILDLGGEYAAIDLIGPRAGEVLEAAAIDEDTDPVIVLHQGSGYVELLVTRGNGPALWNRLLEVGEPFGIACVGLDALEHLAVSEHLIDQRRPGARV